MPGKDYHLVFRPLAQKELRQLPAKIRGQIERTIDRLLTAYQAGERPQDLRAIEGRSNTWGIDSGEYRILYEVIETETEARLRIFRIGHRRDVYRNL